MYWGQTLTKKFYIQTHKTFLSFKQKTDLNFKSIEKFDKSALDLRTKLLYEVAKKIWEVKPPEND